MAWIESHQAVSKHRKTLRAAALLKVDRHKFLGHLHEFWWWGLDNANSQGELGAISDEEVAEAAGWPTKEAEKFVKALLECGGEGRSGFLERHESGLVIHDWYDFAGKLNDQRELRRESNRKAQSAHRQRLRVVTGKRDVSDTVSADISHDEADNQHPTVPNRTQPNLTVPNQPSTLLNPPAGGRTVLDVATIFRGLVVPDDAKSAHDFVVARLTESGFDVTRELWVAERGDGSTGRVDVYAERADGNLAIEIDRRSPRAKSVAKLRHVENAQRVILLRMPTDVEYEPPTLLDVDAIIPLACPDANLPEEAYDEVPVPAHQAQGGRIDFDERPKRQIVESPGDVCCPNFAQTGSEHWTFCPNQPAQVAS